MKGVKTIAANLADRINQAHYLENELTKVFMAGVKYAQENTWIDAKKEKPKLLENENYSLNVLAISNGCLMVMCYCYNPSDYEDGGFFWANCNGKIDGDAEFDDDYDVTHWQHFPSVEVKINI